VVVNGDVRDRRNNPQSFETCAHEGHATPGSGLLSAEPSTRHPSWHVKNHSPSPPQSHTRVLASGLKGQTSIAISKSYETHHKQPRPIHPSHVLGAPDAHPKQATIPSSACPPPEIPAPGAISPATDPPRSLYQVFATFAIAEPALGNPLLGPVMSLHIANV
jgi:hypothetical protein